MLVIPRENTTAFPFHALLTKILGFRKKKKRNETTTFQDEKYAYHMHVSSTDSRLGMVISIMHIKKNVCHTTYRQKGCTVLGIGSYYSQLI